MGALFPCACYTALSSALVSVLVLPNPPLPLPLFQFAFPLPPLPLLLDAACAPLIDSCCVLLHCTVDRHIFQPCPLFRRAQKALHVLEALATAPAPLGADVVRALQPFTGELREAEASCTQPLARQKAQKVNPPLPPFPLPCFLSLPAVSCHFTCSILFGASKHSRCGRRCQHDALPLCSFSWRPPPLPPVIITASRARGCYPGRACRRCRSHCTEIHCPNNYCLSPRHVRGLSPSLFALFRPLRGVAVDQAVPARIGRAFCEWWHVALPFLSSAPLAHS